MVKYYRTVSARIEESRFNKLLEICGKKGCKPNTLLKNYIDKLLNGEKENGIKDERRLDEVETGHKQEDGGAREGTSRVEDGLPY